MIWGDIRLTFEDYFSRENFSFEIVHAEDPMDTECTAVLKVGNGRREQKVKIVLENEANINYLRVLSPIVRTEKCSKEQLIRLMEQNTSSVDLAVGVLGKEVVFTTLVPQREFETDPASLGDAMKNLARKADQIETLLFGSDHF